MKNPMTKLASAAAIIIAVLVIIFPVGNSSVAWGAIAEKIKNVNVVFRLSTKSTMPGMLQGQMQNQETKAYYSSEYGVRVEQYMNGKIGFIMYLNPEKNVYLNVHPEQKMIQKVIDVSQEELRQMAEKEDPRVMVRNMMSMDYKHLDRDTIDGIEVEGIECTGPGVMGGMTEDATARLWVEVGTDYPVRIEIDSVSSNGQMGMNLVMDNFQWDVELDEALFIPDIPSNYTTQELTVGTNEETAINGLRVFAEITGGRYPKSLVFMSLFSEITEELTKKYLTDITEKQDSDKPSFMNMLAEFTEKQGEFTGELMDVLKSATFYTQLAGEGKDVEYYGDTVTADNPEAVLMRWEITRGVYRVVFGDLSTGDFTAEEIAEFDK